MNAYVTHNYIIYLHKYNVFTRCILRDTCNSRVLIHVYKTLGTPALFMSDQVKPGESYLCHLLNPLQSV